MKTKPSCKVDRNQKIPVIRYFFPELDKCAMLDKDEDTLFQEKIGVSK